MAEEAEEAGIGVGVRHRTNGFDDEVSTEACDTVESAEMLLSVLDWRDLRRKGMDWVR